MTATAEPMTKSHTPEAGCEAPAGQEPGPIREAPQASRLLRAAADRMEFLEALVEQQDRLVRSQGERLEAKSRMIASLQADLNVKTVALESATAYASDVTDRLMKARQAVRGMLPLLTVDRNVSRDLLKRHLGPGCGTKARYCPLCERDLHQIISAAEEVIR